MEKLIYLASPYSHHSKIQRDINYLQVLKVCHIFNEMGIPIYSPIVYGHQFAVNCGAPMNYSYWDKLDKVMMDKCTELWVLQIDGWKESTGIGHEVAEFDSKEKKIGFINLDEVNLFKQGDEKNIRELP